MFNEENKKGCGKMKGILLYFGFFSSSISPAGKFLVKPAVWKASSLWQAAVSFRGTLAVP